MAGPDKRQTEQNELGSQKLSVGVTSGDPEVDVLLHLAQSASENAYAPYSNFKVAAVLVTKNGRVFTGVNVENASYGLTICAERTALVKAVSEGEREFSLLLVFANTEKPVTPCGACRQFMAEFGNFEIVLANGRGETVRTTVAELLPHAFSKSDLGIEGRAEGEEGSHISK